MPPPRSTARNTWESQNNYPSGCVQLCCASFKFTLHRYVPGLCFFQKKQKAEGLEKEKKKIYIYISLSFNDIICILLYIFLRFVLFHIESKMSPKKQLRCTEAPRDGFLGSPGTRWVFSFHPYATRFFNSFPNHCTYKPTLYHFEANERPFFSFIFHPFLNKKKKNDVQALMSYFCRKTHMGTC